jgi:hypothetical protein
LQKSASNFLKTLPRRRVWQRFLLGTKTGQPDIEKSAVLGRKLDQNNPNVFWEKWIVFGELTDYAVTGRKRCLDAHLSANLFALSTILGGRFMRIAPVCLAISFFFAAHAYADRIGHWPLDEGSGDTTADVSGSGTTGLIGNAATGGLGAGGSVWVSDPERGTVISFNGDANSAYVRVGDIPQMTLDNDFTWAFWANQDAGHSGNNDVIFGNRYDENGADFVPRQFIKFTPTQFEWHMNGNGNDNLNYDDIPSGEWIHHAVVKDGANLTYYRNGVAQATDMITQALDVPQPLFLGGINTNAAGENWRGMLDDVRIYDHALSAGDVAALVPEPSTLLLLLVAAGLGFGVFRKRGASAV